MFIHDFQSFCVVFSLDAFPINPRFTGRGYANDDSSISLDNHVSCFTFFLRWELVWKRCGQSVAIITKPNSPTTSAESSVEEPAHSSSPSSSYPSGSKKVVNCVDSVDFLFVPRSVSFSSVPISLTRSSSSSAASCSSFRLLLRFPSF